MTGNLAQTPLHSWHAAHGGRMVEFGGWSMPVQYSSIVEEHHACRRAVALFDVSHMGRFTFQGADAGKFLDRLLTRRALDMTPGQVRYGLVCNLRGGILDDVLLYRLGDASWLLVVNASNRIKIWDWVQAQSVPGWNVLAKDITLEMAMIALQGPHSLDLVQPLVNVQLAEMKYYSVAGAKIEGYEGYVSRTGYTGEDGCELFLSPAAAVEVWGRLMTAGAPHGIKAAGLGARDTLRLEAAMPLYGHELGEEINPVQAGIGFAVNTKDREFLGREAILLFQADPNQPKRVGLMLDEKRVPRQHCLIYRGDEKIGEVTSGTFSPTWERPIAMAYVRPEVAAVGTDLTIDIRGTRAAAKVVSLPFYKRAKM